MAELTFGESGYSFQTPVKVRGQVVGFVQRQWEAECAVVGCWAHLAILTSERTKGQASDAVRRHFLETHAEAEPSPKDGE